MKKLHKLQLRFFPTTVRPTSASIPVTSQCNGSCKMCKIWTVKPVLSFTYPQIKEVIDKLHNFGIREICLFGGEPLIHPGVWKFAEYINRSGMTCRMITNGCLVNRNNIGKIKSLFKYIELSMDGTTKAINDSVRFPGSFVGAQNALKLFNEFNISFNIRFTIQKDNMKNALSMLRFCEKNRISLLFGFMMASGYANSSDSGMQKIDMKEFTDLMAYVEKKDPSVLINNRRSLRFIYERLKGNPKQVTCLLPFTWMPLYPNGDIYPCSVIETVIGNIYTQTPEEIFYSQKAQKVYRQIAHHKHPACATCVHLTEWNQTFYALS